MAERTGYAPERITAEHREAVARSKELLANGKTFREVTREDVWRRSEDQYEGNHWSRMELEDPTADLITINVSFSTVNTIIPYITSEDPRFLVEPFSADATAKNARLQQAALNRIWRRIAGRDATRDAAEDYLIYGDGYAKATWSIIERVLEDGSIEETVEIYVDAISPWDVWIDPFSQGVSDARWVAQRVLRTRREMEQDPDIDQALLDDLPWGGWRGDDDDTDRAESATDRTSEQWVEIFEFYDRIDRALYVFTDNVEQPLRVVEEIDCPIFQLANYRITKSPYHMGELEQLWPMQQELNKTRSQLITHRRRNIGKYFYRKGALDNDGIQALQSPIVAEAIEVLGDLPLDSVVRPAQLAALAPEAYNSADTAIRDVYELSGVNEYLRGATPEIRRTATEASIIEGASNVKTRAKLDDVERMVRSVGEYILAIMEEVYPESEGDELGLFLTGPEAQQIARMDGMEQADALAAQGGLPDEVAALMGEATDVDGLQIDIGADIFVGRYQVEVEQGSTEMRNPVFKEQKYREMATNLVSMGPALQQMGVQINVRKVLELWFEAAGVADVEGMFEAAQVPAALPPAEAIPGGGGGDGMPGMPNIAGVGAPVDAPLTAANTGAMLPA